MASSAEAATLTPSRLPALAGIGLKPEHYAAVLETRPALGFFEIHAENYLVAGGPFHQALTRIRAHYPLSIHGVGLSIGSETGLDDQHLDRLAALLDRYQPESFSEHLAWSTHGDVFLNDLLPLPYTPETLARVCTHVDRVQDRLQRRLLLENPATYVEFSQSTLPETEFIGAVVRRTGCGLLLDVNNAYVSCVNHHRDPRAYVEALPLSQVGEIHLAGHAVDIDAAGAPLLIDAHGSAVAEPVWQLYRHALEHTGPVATLIEWDSHIPSLARLVEEARRAAACLSAVARPA
jgi:hypothetical protein